MARKCQSEKKTCFHSTGKSAVMNAMRRTHVRKRNIKGKVEPHSGATRSVQERVKLLDDPLTYCFDTPGVTTPSVGDVGKFTRMGMDSCLFLGGYR